MQKIKRMRKSIAKSGSKHSCKMLGVATRGLCCAILIFILAIEAHAQTSTISGIVKDYDGEVLPGVNIVEKGTTNGTITDIEGRFTMDVPPDATLVFSYIGYLTEEIAVNNRSVIDMALVPDITQLNEVVVIGYGTVKRRDLTGSVASVKSEEIVETPTHNALEAIQGRAAGVDIVRSSGAAGSGVDIFIRGERSISSSLPGEEELNKSEPLFIIDGFQGGNIDDLNPNDIASIEVLKDASATAIYGSQGANGVVIVTTKRGEEGKARISYSGYYGVNGLTEFPDRLIGEDYVQLRREAWRTAGQWSSPADDRQLFSNEAEWAAYQAGQWVDWTDLLMRNGSQQSHTISVNGGSENTKIYLSGGYFRETGMYKLNDMTRYNARLNIDQKLADWAKVGLLSQITYNDINGRNDPLSGAISAIPLGLPYDENGNININPIPGNAGVVSPLADEVPNAAVDNTLETNIKLNAYLELTPLEGLTFRSNFGSSLNNSRQGEYYDKDSYTRRNERTSISSLTTENYRFFHWDNILTYNRDFGDHSVTLTGITSYTQGESDDSYAIGLNQQLASQGYYNLEGTDLTSREIGSGFTRTRTMSYAGRINYSYKGKYLLTVTNRVDGASRLSSGKQWASFPSVAVAWHISDEAFMSNVESITLLKFRASYGLAGNSGIPAYGTQSIVYAAPNMGFGDVPAPMYRFAGRIGNPDVGWENSATTNIGLDLGFFKNRLNATVDVYNTETTDILFPRTLPQSTGVTEVFENIAATRNQGIEVSINSVNVKNDNFSWNSTVTFTKSKNEITELVDGEDIINSNDPERESLLLGHPVNSFYTYKKLGIWQLDEAEEAANIHFAGPTGPTFAPGDIKIEDINGDGVITPADDRQFIGSTVPDWYAGIRNSFRYKAFDLEIFLFARMGQTIDAEFLGRYNPEGTNGTLATFDYWTPENPTNDFPRPRRSSLSGIAGYQSLTFIDGSYFKIKNISLGYNLPTSLSERISVANIRLYATGTNLFVLSKSDLLDNYDPEGGGADSYPINKQIVFGINIDF